MPRRQRKLTLVEGLTMLAILGILMSVMSPARKQAQRRNYRAGRSTAQYAPARGPSVAPLPQSSDGQLNTIRVSELSQGAKRGDSGAWLKVALGLVPVIISIAMIAVIFHRFREQMTRRRPL